MNNIILTGMPGSGKSTVGVVLAKELCMDFIDTDVLIQSGEGAALQEIVDSRGLDELLAVEVRIVLGLDVSNTVIAPGGSVVLSDEAMTALKQSGVVVFLDTPLYVIERRIDMYTRGIIKSPEDSLGDVCRKREPQYRRWADMTVMCGSRDQTAIAAEIAEKYRDRE